MIKVTERKVLGVIVTNHLKCSMQFSAPSGKANIILGFIAPKLLCKTREVITQLYTSLVRPHFEYVIHRFFQKDIKKPESV